MLGRYQMKRGARREDLPKGRRMDTRKHTGHVLRPPADAVKTYLSSPTAEALTKFSAAYRAELKLRWKKERVAFDELADRARVEDVWLGCSCPTRLNPDVRRCHTWLALEFMQAKYPDLDVGLPVND